MSNLKNLGIGLLVGLGLSNAMSSSSLAGGKSSTGSPAQDKVLNILKNALPGNRPEMTAEDKILRDLYKAEFRKRYVGDPRDASVAPSELTPIIGLPKDIIRRLNGYLGEDDQMRFAASSEQVENALFSDGVSSNKRLLEFLRTSGRMIPFQAAQRGDLDVLRMIAKKAPEVFTDEDDGGENLAHRLASVGSTTALKFIALHAPETLGKAAASNGFTPAHWAAIFGHADALKVIAQFAPQTLGQANNSGETPGIRAAMGNHASALRVILESGTNASDFLHVMHEGFFYPGHTAAMRGSFEVLNVILEFDPTALSLSDRGGYSATYYFYCNNMRMGMGIDSRKRELFNQIAEKAPASLDYKTAKLALDQKDLESLRTIGNYAPYVLKQVFLEDGRGMSGVVYGNENNSEWIKLIAEFAPESFYQNPVFFSGLFSPSPEEVEIIVKYAPRFFTMPDSHCLHFFEVPQLRVVAEHAPHTLAVPNRNGVVPAVTYALWDKEDQLEIIAKYAPLTLKIKDPTGKSAIDHLREKGKVELADRLEQAVLAGS